jgi:hypothetical protein
MRAYLTKPIVHHVCFAGIDRCTLWFLDKPQYHPILLECPVFGEIDPLDVIPSQWTGDFGVSAKIIRKNNKALVNFVWKTIIDTYVCDTLIELSKLEKKAVDDFYKNRPTLNNPNHATRLHESDEMQRFISSQVEKPDCQQNEWMLELDLDMSLSKNQKS